MGEDVGNVRQGRVMVVMMLVFLLVAFLLPMAEDLHVGAGNAAFLTLFCRDFNAGQVQFPHFRQKNLRLRQQLQQRPHEHIPCRTHAAIQVQCSHCLPPMWFIMPARYPAPKPLSMFTTLTPLAQEFSMDSRAATPPKAAP